MSEPGLIGEFHVGFGGTAIYVDDVPAALDFYRRAFGLATRFFDEALQYGELETGGSLVAFASHQLGAMLMPDHYQRSESGQPSGVEIAFLTCDATAAFARAVAAGAVPLAPPKVMPWGATVAYLRAPEGTIIGLSTPVTGQKA
jgi:predicted enzyme related to lactoylglutathione lyase